ncbi:MAG: DUF4147 domain-containing protein [Planctomycetota bacterium]
MRPMTVGRRRRDALAIWRAGVEAVRPEAGIAATVAASSVAVRIGGRRYLRRELDRVLVLGAGKAAGDSARALVARLAPVIAAGLRVEGILNVGPDAGEAPPGLEFVLARRTHENLPTEDGDVGARRIRAAARAAGPRDLVIVLVSGGGSALLPLPAEGLTLADKVETTRRLAAAGAPIGELNLVRKHLSAIKGGRLAAGFRGRALETLILSDVVGDPLPDIASGPTVADEGTFAEALAVVDARLGRTRLPARVRRHLERGAAGERPEGPRRLPARVHHTLMGSADLALAAMDAEARRRGWPTLDLGARLEGDTAALAGILGGVVRSVLAADRPAPAPLCLLSGGETTVTLGPKPGRGGRNQEFALRFFAGLPGADRPSVSVLAAGSDGEDGPTDAAGALLDAPRFRRLRSETGEPQVSLGRHDVHPLLDRAGALLRTGPTGTNVMDLRVILVGSPSATRGRRR